MNAPAIAAISNPPSLPSTSNASALSGLFTAIPRAIALRFRISPASLSPAPRPTASSIGVSVSTAATADAVVVLPMPISPVTISL